MSADSSHDGVGNVGNVGGSSEDDDLWSIVRHCVFYHAWASLLSASETRDVLARKAVSDALSGHYVLPTQLRLVRFTQHRPLPCAPSGMTGLPVGRMLGIGWEARSRMDGSRCVAHVVRRSVPGTKPPLSSRPVTLFGGVFGFRVRREREIVISRWVGTQADLHVGLACVPPRVNPSHYPPTIVLIPVSLDTTLSHVHTESFDLDRGSA